MLWGRLVRCAAAAGLLIVAGNGGAAQRHPAAPSAIAGIELGEWSLRAPDGAQRRLCIADRWAVLQIMHGNTQCEHFVMENTPRATTIRYTCPNHGHGRTRITVDTPRVIDIDTQGVADGQPFSEQFEGRRIGNCN